MIDNPLDIPPFLRRQENTRSTRGSRQSPERQWIMPPVALGAVARAVRTGCDTMQKIRKRTRGRYSDNEIRKALRALIRSSDILRNGRQYRSQRTTPKP